MSVSLRGRDRVIYIGPLVTMFDRYSIAPLLIPISVDLHRPLAQVAVVASLYFFLYGAMQVVYGLLSDRVGRIRVMRYMLAGMAVADLLSAFAPSLEWLIAARALTGALACAVMPAALVYMGDTFEFKFRQAAIADLLAAVAVGISLATLGAGLIAHVAGWRAVFLVPAAAGLAVAIALGRVPESPHQQLRGQAGPLAQLRTVLTRPWAVFVNLFALLEGAAMLGFITFFAPALEAHGENAATAGLVTAAYGLSVLLLTRVMRRLAVALPGHVLILAGGAALFAGYLLASARQDVPAILVTCALAGCGYSVMHSTFQTWATDTVPEARGTSTALFATGAFLGAAIGTQALAGFAGSRDYHGLFLACAAATAPMVLVGALARWRYPGSVSVGAVAPAHS